MALEMFPRDGVQRVCTVSQVFLAECQKLLASGSIFILSCFGARADANCYLHRPVRPHSPTSGSGTILRRH